MQPTKHWTIFCALLAGAFAQCPSTFILSTTINGQTYYFNAFSPYISENSSPPTLFQQSINATLFSLSPNGTAVAQVPGTSSGRFANQDLAEFTQGQVTTEPVSILYAEQNRRLLYPLTLQCAADGSVTFTVYGLNDDENPVNPEISPGSLACPNGDNGQFQLFNAGTTSHPSGGIINQSACVTGLIVKAVIPDSASSSSSVMSSSSTGASGSVTPSSLAPIAGTSTVGTADRPMMTAGPFSNSTIAGTGIGAAGTVPSEGPGSSNISVNVKIAVIISIVVFSVPVEDAQGSPFQSYGTSYYTSTLSYMSGEHIVVAGSTIAIPVGAALPSLTATVTTSSLVGAPIAAPSITIIGNPGADSVSISSVHDSATATARLPTIATVPVTGSAEKLRMTTLLAFVMLCLVLRS